MSDLGVIFRPQQDLAGLRAAVTAADAAGVTEFWLWEDCFDHGGVSTMAAALAWTDRLRVGIGLLPVPLRNAALTAMEAASLARLFPGRVELGLGHGVQDWMQQVGARAASPMTLLREYTSAVRALLDGQTLDVEGRYVTQRGVTLGWPPAQLPRLQVGAVGDRTVALAGEVGDGLILTGGTTPEQLQAKRAVYDHARGARPGRVTVFVVCADTEAGFAAEAEHWEFEASRDTGVWGDAEQVAGGLRRWIDAGADALALQPPAGADVAAFARWAGEQVRPLLDRSPAS